MNKYESSLKSSSVLRGTKIVSIENRIRKKEKFSRENYKWRNIVDEIRDVSHETNFSKQII